MIIYEGKEIKVSGGAWLDAMNSCFYTVIDEINHYSICREIGSGELFALPK